jgi:hypothetical protein
MAVIPAARALHQIILIARARTLVIVDMLVARARAVVMFVIVVMSVARARTVAIYPADRSVMQL